MLKNASGKPTDYGFADNGEAWSAFGKAEGLLSFLEKKSLAVRDWFVLAHWADNEPVIQKIPKMKKIYPIQNYVNAERVAEYCYEGGVSTPAKSFEKYPVLFKVENKIFIFQGTHRLAALKKQNADYFLGYFLDLD